MDQSRERAPNETDQHASTFVHRHGNRHSAPLISLSFSVCLALTGCMVGPNYQKPEALVNDAWQTQVGTPPDEAEVRWWESFEDPTLTSLVETALAENLSLRAAGLRVIEARAARGISVGQFFPQQQSLFGTIAANELSKNDALSGADRSFWTDSIGFQAAWELDFWGKFRRGIEAADAGVLQSVADYDAVMISLIGEVASSYILIRSLQERLDFARANASLQSETLSLTQARFDAGAVSELDVATARGTLAITNALIPTLENELRQQTLVLCTLLGRTPSDLTEELKPAAGTPVRVPVAKPRIAAGIPADLLRRRPEVRAAERAAAAQSARIGQAAADLYPQISITGATGFASSTYDSARNPDLGDIFDANSFAGFIGLDVNWPILNYGRIRGNIRVQDARYEQAVARYQDTVLRAAADVESGLSAFLRSVERTRFLKDAVDASQRSVELSLIQYRAGAVDFIRVNDAQSSLVEQEDNLVVSRAEIALAAVRTYRALGGGWEIRTGREFVDPETAERMRQRTNWGNVLGSDWDQGQDLGFQRPDTSVPTPDEGNPK